ncbi:unnamed protein product [Sphenostylis stenocarpa]|uniref:Uncharacterized protein n=1 Tax=Sphenostylis stenocarpa TaxID=92480 RepID=A0AA86VVT3_9FABA|nr:unnamed protein product [Sphenostylis stenocarpa]
MLKVGTKSWQVTYLACEDSSISDAKFFPVCVMRPGDMQFSVNGEAERCLLCYIAWSVMRLVNVVVEKTRKKEVTSITVAADAIGISRMLIDIRHEGSHWELPSLKIVRSASVKALVLEIVSVLLEYLLKALSSSELEENADDASIGLTTKNVLADWKLILLKLCNKEPELLLNLLKEVLDMIESREDMKREEDNPNMGISQSRTEFRLSSLFAWSSGCLPVLDIFDNEKQNQVSSGCLPVVDITDYEEQDQLLEKKESWKLAPHGAKRDATFDLLQLEKSTVKKMRGTEEFSELNNEFPLQGDKGYLIVGGVWRKLTEEELLVIESSVRILV